MALRSLTTKLALASTAQVAIVVTVLVGFVTFRQQSVAHDLMSRATVKMAEVVAENVAPGLVRGDQEWTQHVLATLKANPNAVYGRVLGASGEELVKLVVADGAAMPPARPIPNALKVADVGALVVARTPVLSPLSGEPIGGVEVAMTTAQVDVELGGLLILILLLAAGLVGASALLSVLAGRMVARPLERAVSVLESFARGDLACLDEPMPPEPTTSEDEVGRISRALGQAVLGMQAVHQTFQTLSSHVGIVSSGGEQLTTFSSLMAENARDSQRHAECVVDACASMKGHIDSVDRSAAQVSSYAESLAAQVQLVSDSTDQAAALVKETRRAIEDLGARSVQVEHIVKVINTIADQTRLLALNATIEATRAGEAGRGFGVVAAEVRELAQESLTSANSIQEIINGIRRAIAGCAQDVARVGEVMMNLNAFQASVAGTAAEQQAVSEELHASIVELAQIGATLSSVGTEALSRAKDTFSAVHGTLASSEELAATSQELERAVSQYVQ